jgi:hypothetical protein
MRAPYLAGGMFALVSACASPFGGQDIDLIGGFSTFPGVGGTLGIAQRIQTHENIRFDFEMDIVHQELDKAGPSGENDFDQVRAGLKASYPADSPNRGTARLGIVWLRTLGDAVGIDGEGDFGGGFLGLGYQFRLTPHLSLNPDLCFALVDAEGGGDFGAVVEITWRFLWHL